MKKIVFPFPTARLILLFWLAAFIPEIPASIRLANTTLTLPERLNLSGYSLTNAFADLAFDQPVAAMSPPDETNRFFVVEKSGRIMVITNLANPTKTLFLDLTAGLHANYMEAGLLGMAFHPGFATNRFFYVYRTLYTRSASGTIGFYDQLSRFEVSTDNPNLALPESELPIISQLDDSDTHNAGDVQFGPDGYLYLSLGDEGPAPEELDRTKQPIDKSFFGVILRIDVDKRPENLSPNPHPASTTNYAIPADNPFVGATNYQGLAVNPDEVRTEIYALGFRNPWRMSFDPQTGLLYCGEVGQGATEEVNVISKGGNYGWPFMEGTKPMALLTEAPPGFSSIHPLITYNHGKGTNEGEAIIGGIVYRGDRIPQLQGNYLFGDNVLGHIWAVYYDGTNKPSSFQWLMSDPGISAFARDPRNGEALVINFHDGKIKQLVYTSPEEAAPFPPTLAETGAFENLESLSPNPGIMPYQINVPFWSDNAIKSRWFSVPDINAKIGFNSVSNWIFPNGSVWIKHFELELTNGVPESRRRIETRFLVKNESGAYGVTYRWDDSQTNANLVDAAGMTETFQIHESSTVRDQVWRYPSRAECMFCHSAAASYALGFNTWQLNRKAELEGENQIEHLSDLGYFDGPVPDHTELPALAHATNTNYSIGSRARSFLAANCSSCHQPNGSYTMTARWDGRITTRFADTALAASLIKPNAPSESGLLGRISASQYFRMPIVGSTVLDTNAIELIKNWILSFPPAPWKYQDIGEVGREGDSAALDGQLQVSGSGAGIGGAADQFQFLSQAFSGNGQIIARLARTSMTSGKAGIMLRESNSSGSKNAALLAQSGTGPVFQSRMDAASETVITSTNAANTEPWLRLVRQGNVVTAYDSSDGLEWIEQTNVTVNFSSNILAGLAVSANNNAALNLAAFDQVSVMNVGIQIDAEKFVAPANVLITSKITTSGNPIGRVEYFSGAEKLGETTNAPFTFMWSNAPVGLHEVRVRVIDSAGAAVWSEVGAVDVEFPEPSAVRLDSDFVTSGNWRGNFGADGYLIPANATSLPFYAQLIVTNDAVVWQGDSAETRALVQEDSTGRIASAWEVQGSFTVDLELQYGQFRRVSLYFLDWDGNNQRSQTVEVLDANNSVLYTRNVRNFSSGKYLVLLLRGHVKIRITPTGTGSAVLSGIFFDSHDNEAPTVSLTSPVNGEFFTLPGHVILEANAIDLDSEISRVDFFADGKKLGESTTPPYRFVWTNMLAGTSSLTARAVDEFNSSASSEPVTITTSLPLANAVFLQSDESTKGNWRGQYGVDGYALANHSLNLPEFFGFDAALPRTFTWAGFTDDFRALQHVEGDSRIAATWVETDSFTLEFRLTDGKNHRVAFYFLDWDNAGRGETVSFMDGETGRVLDMQQITNFSGGKYFVWNMRGHLKVQVKRTTGVNTALSGIFIDPDTNVPPTVQLIHPLSGTALTAPQHLLLSAETSDDNAVSRVEFFADNQKIGEADQPPFDFLWQALAGEHALLAKAIDSNGAATDSEPVHISIQITNAAAQFLGEDSATLGDWKGIYGTLGYNIINESENYPHFVALSVSGNQSFTWAYSTSDVRAPRNALSPGRIAGSWVSQTNFIIDLSLGDGIPRKVSFYCLDWDRGGRQQTFTIRDAATGAILDKQTAAEFQEGKYLSWSLLGHITVEISAEVGNAVISSVLFDPVFTPSELWKWFRFSPQQLDDPAFSGEMADPDGDGIPNLLEYAYGMNPLLAETNAPLQAKLYQGSVQVTFQRGIAATDLNIVLEGSDDLVTWQPVQDFIERTETKGPHAITVRCRLPIGQDSRKFLRLHIQPLP